jgi:hypothetical protein
VRHRAGDAAEEAGEPARAPLDRSSPASGIFTDEEVMFTIRPNRRSTIPSTTRCTSSIGTIMLPTTPAIARSRSMRRKSANGGPALLVTRMSGPPGGRREQRRLTLGRGDVSRDRDDLGAGRGPDLLRARSSTARRGRSRPPGSRPAPGRWRKPRPRPRLDAQTTAVRPAIPRSMEAAPGGRWWRAWRGA